MAKEKVLAIGIDPSFLDFSALPQFTPELFRQHIDRVRALGSNVTLCLIDLGDTAETVVADALRAVAFLRLRADRGRPEAAAGAAAVV